MIKPPTQAIREKCLDCSGNSKKRVNSCPLKDCEIYPYRFGKHPQNKQDSANSPLTSIREKCLDCCNGNKEEVKLCPVTTCPFYHFRLGTNPNRRGIGISGNIKGQGERINS